MKFNLKKIRASVLQFSILIATLVALLLLSFITLTHTHRFFKIQSDNFRATIDNAQEGIILSLEPDFKEGEIISEKENSQLDISTSYWGGFQKVTSVATKDSKTFSQMALVGALAENKRTALYLVDNNNALVLVGNTNIEGLSYIPSKGVKAGSIAGNYYNGKNLISGEIRHSNSRLPKLHPTFLNFIKALQKTPDVSESLVVLEGELKNSFFEKEKVVYSPDMIVFTGKATGNMRIQSDREVTIDTYAQLTDVTIVAPIIRVQEGFNGRVHLIASDSIVIEKNVVLNYPSSLVLSEKSDSKDNEFASIEIEEPSTIQGIVIHLQNREPEKATPNIVISKGASIEGEVYCEGHLELLGKVNGTVYTNKFLVRAPGGVYINHLYDGSISAKELPQEFSGLPLEKSTKGIVQWLY
tara:strand:- start:410752 stop:411990 length:1239 start_codon:yes stop_codon:yes gene_type:complete